MRLGLFLALARRRRTANNSNRVTVSFGAPPSVTPTTYAPAVSISGGPVSITTGAPSGVTPTTYAFIVSPVQIETGSPANVTPTTYAPTVSVVTDETAPVIVAAWDEANNEIDLTITEDNFPVTVRWQIRAVATAAPDESAMLAGTGGVLAGSYSAASTPDSEVIDVSSLTDATDYTLYVMVSDPAGNHSAISDDDFTYTDPAIEITMGSPSGVTPTTYAPTVSVSGGAVSITTGTPSSVSPTTYAPDVSVSGGSTSFTMLADLYNETDGTGYTFTSQTEANIICVVGRRGSGTNAAPSAVTMNGNTCTELASGVFGTDVISFWKCPDADGSSSGDLVVTFSDTQARAFARTAYVEGFDLSGSVSDSAFDMNNDNVAGSLSIDCPAGGLIFACARLHTISGLANAEASSYEVPAAWEIFAGAQTAFSITLGNSGASDQLGGAISLAAA